MEIPFFRPDIREAEINEVLDTLRSGWLTTGAKVRAFEAALAASVGATSAVALNSCTAALHLAVEALSLQPGQGVLVPTMTFAATAEVVRYLGGIPILVDCLPDTLNLDLAHAEDIADRLSRGLDVPGVPAGTEVVGIMPVHYAGLMVDMGAVRALADRFGLWVVEDAAHALPAAWRPSPVAAWQRCGENTAAVTCYSFYANKTVTTGEGGMAVTNDPALAERMRLMSLHGLSRDAWGRYSGSGTWDYRIIAPGFKYNLTDVAAAIGIHQLSRAEDMRQARERRVRWYDAELAGIEGLERPVHDADRLHAWHLYVIKLEVGPDRPSRNAVIDGLKQQGVTCSVHWRPLHLHPYYQDRYGYGPQHCPTATRAFERIISLPLYPTMTDEEATWVVGALRSAWTTAVAH